MQRPLILASSSSYRRELLARLRLPFACVSPDIDETPRPGETPRDLVLRLAVEKARAVARKHGGALVIGSDQAAVLGDSILGKPLTRERAIVQLSAMSGRSVEFLTGLCLLNAQSGQQQVDCVTYTVHFAELARETIERYVDLEQPFNCAGSFKSEALGICLVSRFEGGDPTALIGLPLIRLTEMLRFLGVQVPV
jgi:MAF protein